MLILVGVFISNYESLKMWVKGLDLVGVFSNRVDDSYL